MLPTIIEAEKELKLAGEMNPGPWVKHSINVGIAAKNITHKLPDMDEDKAYIVGILHDIGRRVGVVNIPKHVYEGYKYSMDKGWDEVAKICMTHSYPLMKDEPELFISNPKLKYVTILTYLSIGDSKNNSMYCTKEREFYLQTGRLSPRIFLLVLRLSMSTFSLNSQRG